VKEPTEHLTVLGLDWRWRDPIELWHARTTARLASAVRGAQVSKMRLGVYGMQELEQELKRLLETAWKLQPGPVRNQIFRELEQFRLRINALQKRAELPERKNAPA
jgi:hypothetical protein